MSNTATVAKAADDGQAPPRRAPTRRTRRRRLLTWLAVAVVVGLALFGV